MKVSWILDIIPRGTVVQVYQTPIARIDQSRDPVHRQTGEVGVLLSSKQNYLDFEAKELKQVAGILTIVCAASPQQERETVASLYGGRGAVYP